MTRAVSSLSRSLALSLSVSCITVAAPAEANDDDGSSGILIVRRCDGLCADGSTCGDGGSGLCENGDVCVTATCADGSDCGAEDDAGLCDNEAACQPTRFGGRCTATGSGDRCDPDYACRIDAIYFGSEKECVYSLQVREPYCIKNGEYVRSKWTECGAGETPTTVDTCDDSSPCYYCLGVPAACDDGSRCGSGGIDDDGAAKCADGDRCLFNTCADGSVCATSGVNAGKCTNGQPCDCLPSTCADSSVCGSGGPGLCANKAPCFRPRGDRAKWRFATGNLVLADAVLGSCTTDPAMHWDSSIFYDSDTGNDRPVRGLDPQPVGNDCIFIGGKDQRFYALDEESLPPLPSPTPTPGPSPTPNKFKPLAEGACLWSYDVDGWVFGRAAMDPDDPQVYVAGSKSTTGDLWKLNRHPVAVPSPACTPSATFGDPFDCQMTMGDFDSLPYDSKVEGDVVVAFDGASPLDDRVLVGTHDGISWVDTSSDPIEEDFLDDSGKSYTRGILQDGDGDGIFYSSTGDSENANALAAFELVSDALVFREVVASPDDVLSDPPGCGASGGTTDFNNAQFHRTTPVTNEDGDHFFLGNRNGGSFDTSDSILAFERVGSSENISASKLAACWPAPNSRGITAPVAYARVPCESQGCCVDVDGNEELDEYECCGCIDGPDGGSDIQPGSECSTAAEEIDRFFVGTKKRNFYGVNFCDPTDLDEESTDPPYFYEVFDTESALEEPDDPNLNSFRAQAAVALELGTVFVFDENSNEHMYALDIHTGQKKWEYWVSDPAYNVSAACSGRDEGENCYPAPMPILVDYTPNFSEIFPVDDLGCYSDDSLALAVDAHAFPDDPPAPGEGDFWSPAIDSNAPDWRLPLGMDVLHMADGLKKQYHWTCHYFCGGWITLVEGWNEIVTTIYDNAGKLGSSRVRVEYVPLEDYPELCSNYE